jgi:hypothetical protein
MARWSPQGEVFSNSKFKIRRRKNVKLAARVVELKTQIKIHLPSNAPHQAIFGMLLAK